MDSVDSEDRAPAVPWSRLLAWNRDIRETLLTQRGVAFEPDAVVPAIVAALLPASRRSQETPEYIRAFSGVWASVQAYSGMALGAEKLVALARRLAGNSEVLKAGRPALPWIAQMASEWVVLKVEGGHSSRMRRRGSVVFGAVFQLRVLSGSPSSKDFAQFFTDAAMSGLARRMGFPLPRYAQLHTAAALALGVFQGRLEPGEELRVGRFACSPVLKKRNRELFEARLNRECPRGYKWACERCPVGYNSCPFGTHAKDYEIRRCPGPPPHRGWFEENEFDDFCVKCKVRKRTGGLDYVSRA